MSSLHERASKRIIYTGAVLALILATVGAVRAHAFMLDPTVRGYGHVAEAKPKGEGAQLCYRLLTDGGRKTCTTHRAGFSVRNTDTKKAVKIHVWMQRLGKDKRTVAERSVGLNVLLDKAPVLHHSPPVVHLSGTSYGYHRIKWVWPTKPRTGVLVWQVQTRSRERGTLQEPRTITTGSYDSVTVRDGWCELRFRYSRKNNVNADELSEWSEPVAPCPPGVAPVETSPGAVVVEIPPPSEVVESKPDEKLCEGDKATSKECLNEWEKHRGWKPKRHSSEGEPEGEDLEALLEELRERFRPYPSEPAAGLRIE